MFLRDSSLATTATALVDGRFILAGPYAVLGDLVRLYGAALGRAFLDAPRFMADTLTHNDMRSDNLLVVADDTQGASCAYILDWTQVVSGPA